MIKNAKWIISSLKSKDAVPEFYKPFAVSGKVEKATLYITAFGVYEASINGKRVGDFIMAPGWTVYSKRLQYQEYDVTDMLRESNTLSVLVGKGWASGKLTYMPTRRGETFDTRLIAFLDIKYCNGRREAVATDRTWLCRESKTRFSDIYDGEVYDSTFEAAYSENAIETDHTYDILIPTEGEKVCEHEIFAVEKLIKTPKGETVLDFGQNLTGYVAFADIGNAGDITELSFAEVLDRDGNFYNTNYRSAKSRLEYVSDGRGEEYKPHLTFFGFRYVRLDKYPKELTEEMAKKAFRAIAVYSNLKRTGSFRCSNPLINKLFENTVWSQKDNSLDIPTDCPQRDERLGWTGDAQVFIRTAAYNLDVKRFFTKWLRDMQCAQRPNGAIPPIVPDVLPDEHFSSAAWGDAAVICPWQLYLTYGDTAILTEFFGMMKKWVDYQRASGPDEHLWLGGEHFGDWLGLDAPEGSYKGSTDDDLIASAFYAYSASLLIKAGETIGLDMAEYRRLYDSIKRAFNDRFIQHGTLVCDTQTAHALTLYFDLAYDKKPIAERLNKLVKENGCKLKTGFVGSPYLLHALSENGYTDTAYSLLLGEEYPSWLYSVKQGATTVWEHWDGIKPDGTMWSDDMNSFNHYAYGSVCDWMYSVIAGIRIDEAHPGLSHFILKPVTDSRLDFAEASLETAYGVIRSSWRHTDSLTEYSFSVPKGCTAKLILPSLEKELTYGEYSFKLSR